MVTMRKIAEIAKVSRGTVDKVLNNRPGVSDEVRKRVMEIAEALNYRPNVIGTALANQRKSFLIGVIVPPDTNPYFDDIKRGIYAAYEEVKDCGVKIIYQVMKSLEPNEQLHLIDFLVGKGISALM
jgi:LacI family transcriptional regulator